MTSRLTNRATTHIPYRAVLPEGFLCPDPDHRPDGMYQAPIIDECGHLLRDHFAVRPDVIVDSGGFVFYDQRSLNVRVRPDIYVALGVDAAAVFSRNGYVVWEAGKPPDFVLEVASESTHTVDTDRKPDLYARIGVGEYWRFDPTGGEFYGYHLAGDTLVDGVYQPIPVTTEPDEMTWGYSPALDLNLCARDRRLVFHDPNTGLYLRNISEANSALAERTADLQASEAETERLREELRRLQGRQ